MAIYAKNADTVAHSWVGMEIQPGNYYALEALEEAKWANDSQVLTDIGNGTLVIANDDSGSSDISDVSEAINYLKGRGPVNEDGFPVIAPSFEDTGGLTTVWKGYQYTALPGTMNCYDQAVTTQIKVRGGWYELLDDNANIGDYVEFSIVDKDDVLGLFSTYGLEVGVDILEIKKFIRTEYVSPVTKGRQDFTSDGATTVMAGLYMRVCYMNTGTEDVQFKVVEKHHEV